MHSNPHIPMDTRMRERLLREMRQYHGEYGIYAADMLETARLLLKQPEQHPRQAEAAACCIRQAVKEIFGDTRDYTEQLSDMVQRVAEAKDSIQTASIVNEEGLQKLYKAVDDLKERECSPKPEARLKEIFRNRSGIDPEAGRPSLITEYRRILRESNGLLHDVSETPTDADKVCDHYEDVVDVLSLIFLASERLARIERLAELPEPQESDLVELRRIMNNAYGFNHFASKMGSPAWFDMMEPDMLKSPSGDPPWLLGCLAERLNDEHVDAFTRMLENNFDIWASDDVGLGELGFVGYKLDDRGLPWLVKTLQVSKRVRMERDKKIKIRSEANQLDAEFVKESDRIRDSIWHLDYYARRAFLKTERPNYLFVELAEHLLSSDSTVDTHYKTNTIPAKLVEGMDRASAIHIVEILVRELRARLESRSYLRIPRLDSIDRPDYYHTDGVNGLVASLCRALAKAWDLGAPMLRLIGALGSLPKAARPRFEAWLYSHIDDVVASEIVRYMVYSCNSRPPNDEDGLLLDRLERDGHILDISEQIVSLLGRAPDTKKMSGRPRQWEISREERWHILWARTIRPWIKLPDEWKPCLSIVDGLYEAERDSGSRQAPGDSGSQDDATRLGVSGTDDPLEVVRKIAAKKPDASGFLGLTDEHSPILYLENTVKNNVSKWAEDPVGIIRELRHPEYVAGYFRGLTGAEECLTPYADRIVSAVKSARTIQWDGGALGSTAFYHDGEPTSVDMAGMKLVEKMVKNNVGLGEDSLADVWSVVSEAVVLPDPEMVEQPDCSIEYLYTVDSLPHARAACTLVEVIRYAKLNKAKVPEMALARLAEAVRLTGQYGVDYHACIGPRASFMRVVEPEWFEQNEQYLFGSAASAELGRVALDVYLMWYQPDAFILEKYREGVLDAVRRDVHTALHRLLDCMLYGMRGYEPEYVAKNLMKNVSEHVLKTVGWHMHKLLPEGSGADRVQRGTAFWASMLEQPPKPEALAGFGWWADVPEIDQERWEELMLRTCEMTEKLDWPQRVAERISTSETITDAGWRILAQLFSIDLGHYKGEVAKHAIDALRKTAGIADAPESRSHLCEVLINHGFHDAREFQ